MKKPLLFGTLLTFSIIMVATVFAQIYPTGMISYWKLDDGAGIIAGDSVGANDGTLINGPVWTTGQVGGALSFDGVDDCVYVADSVNLDITSTITLEAWVNPQLSEQLGGVIVKSDYTANYLRSYFLYLWDGKARFGLASLDEGPTWHVEEPYYFYYLTSPTLLPLNSWTHIVATYDGTEQRMFINGELQAIANIGSISIQASAEPLHLGCGDDSVPEQYKLQEYHFNGLIDEGAVYDRALTAEEIQQHYQNGLAGLGYELVIPATIDIDPDTLNLKSHKMMRHGRWVTVYIELPEGYNVNLIDINTVELTYNGTAIPAVNDTKYGFVTEPESYITDNDEDGILERMVKFDRSDVIDQVKAQNFTLPADVELAVTGKVIYNGGDADFKGTDTFRVIEKGKQKNQRHMMRKRGR